MFTFSVDLLCFGAPPQKWAHGNIHSLPDDVAELTATLNAILPRSEADFLLLWRGENPLPPARVLSAIIEGGADVAHLGLTQGLGHVWRDLNMVMQDWSMINAPKNRVSISWRLGLDACLIRRQALLQIGGLDAAYQSRSGAGLDLGRRLLASGAIIEYRPDLGVAPRRDRASTQDFYVFLLRHYGLRWAQYVAARRALRKLSPGRESAHLKAAQTLSTQRVAPPSATLWFSREAQFDIAQAEISVIIPTLGRYPYLPGALESLRRQTVRPREVIVVDQNSVEERRPQTYEGYDDLNLRVIYQDERGQSLARNGGIEAAQYEWIFLFDDDSIAHDDLLEQHLRVLSDGRFQVSTGVANDPDENEARGKNILPERFRHPRVAQTLDTGNCFLKAALARALGGLDRNYDFGPATDLDFGTRLYLQGYRIAHNPRAVRVHFKAPMGGLRVHGAKKYNTDSDLLAPFPPVTLSYYGLRYLTSTQRKERALLQFVVGKAAFIRNEKGKKGKLTALGNSLLTTFFLPLKAARARRQARRFMASPARVLSTPPHDTPSHEEQSDEKRN